MLKAVLGAWAPPLRFSFHAIMKNIDVSFWEFQRAQETLIRNWLTGCSRQGWDWCRKATVSYVQPHSVGFPLAHWHLLFPPPYAPRCFSVGMFLLVIRMTSLAMIHYTLCFFGGCDVLLGVFFLVTCIINFVSKMKFLRGIGRGDYVERHFLHLEMLILQRLVTPCPPLECLST